ncbi:MAG: hypothetical protein VX730_07000 [Pseudomonadota bacterium]|nr:hypothetical protein [Pseudomonadota bacterium]
MTQLNSTAKTVVRYVAFLRACVLPMQTSDGQIGHLPASYGLAVAQADGEGYYQIYDTAPALDDSIAAVLEIECVHVTVTNDAGDVLYDDLVTSPLEDGTAIGAVVAEDVLFDAERIQKEQAEPGQEAEINALLDGLGVTQVLMLFNPYASGAELLALEGTVVVEKTPKNIQDAIDAEGKEPANTNEPAEDPNTIDDMFDGDDD